MSRAGAPGAARAREKGRSGAAPRREGEENRGAREQPPHRGSGPSTLFPGERVVVPGQDVERVEHLARDVAAEVRLVELLPDGDPGGGPGGPGGPGAPLNLPPPPPPRRGGGGGAGA